MKTTSKQKCLYVVTALFIITIGLLFFTHYEIFKSRKLIDKVEYYDSLNRYNQIYYEGSFNDLKKTNKQLYDSLKIYKDKISYLIQFTHENEYNTGIVHDKPTVKDSVVHDGNTITIPLVSKTYEYLNEKNDTFTYKLRINSNTEPNWYSLQAKVKNKFTIVNKDEGNGQNHIVIEPNNGGIVSDVTVYKKKRRFLDRVSIGPGVTAGYDPINRKFGVMIGVTGAIDLK